MMHLAAQYLAAAGISFLEKKEDDSHTNLEFTTDSGVLYSRPLNEGGDKMGLNYTNFSLEWQRAETITSFHLDGKTHADVLDWIGDITRKAGFANPYTYGFHYVVPYPINASFTYKLDKAERLRELMHLRTLAQQVIEEILKDYSMSSEIRIWPHHFDTGAYASLPNKNHRSIGFGLAVPDSLVNDHYFYLSGYEGHNALDTSEFGALSRGQWHSKGFKGATLAATGIDKAVAKGFFTEAIKYYHKKENTG